MSNMEPDASTAAPRGLFGSIAAVRVVRSIKRLRADWDPWNSSQAAIPIERAAPPRHTIPLVHSLKASGRRPPCARRVRPGRHPKPSTFSADLTRSTACQDQEVMRKYSVPRVQKALLQTGLRR